MSRSIRIEYPQAIYHLTNRGNANSDIYIDDSDRLMFLETLAQVVKRFGWVCHAYCLMNNHYHLMIQTPRANLGQGMRQLNGVYTQRFNRKHKRIGHLFQGRYKAIIIDGDSYLLELCRYIIHNPVAAHMVRHVGDWQWSSYRATMGLEAAPKWLHIEWILSQFGTSPIQSRKYYEKFVADGGNQPSIWEDLSQQVYLGDDAFIEHVKSNLSTEGTSPEIPKAQWKPLAKSLEIFKSECGNNGDAMARAYLEGGYKMNNIAEYFHVHYATVSRAVKKWEENA